MMKRFFAALLAAVCILSAVCFASCSQKRTFEDIYNRIKSDIDGYSDYKMTVKHVSEYTTSATKTTINKSTVKVYKDGKYYTSQTGADSDVKDAGFQIWYADSAVYYVSGEVRERYKMTLDEYNTKANGDVRKITDFVPAIDSEYLKAATFEKLSDNTYCAKIELPKETAAEILQSTGIIADGDTVESYIYRFVFNNDDTLNSIIETAEIKNKSYISTITSTKTVSNKPTADDIPEIPDAAWTDK